MKNNLKKLWFIFAQTFTVSLVLVILLKMLFPELLSGQMHQANFISRQTPVESFHATAAKAMPSVVNIFTSKKMRAHPRFHDDEFFQRFFGESFPHPMPKDNRLGSGVIVRADGYIVTNHHVVESADVIQVALNNGKIYSAKVIGSDPESDIAVLKINANQLPVIDFAEVNTSRIGDVVLAIGNPFGVGQTITQGIISGLGRNHLGINTFEDFIQTDAAINPGNSGGALVNTKAQLVGINSAIFSKDGGSMGIGFAIPISIVKKVIPQIIQHGSVTRGWIGIQAQDLTEDLKKSFNLDVTSGCLITAVVLASPAEQAGLKAGDVIVEIDTKKFFDTSSMIGVISELQPGSKAKVKLIREEKLLTMEVQVGKRPNLVN